MKKCCVLAVAVLLCVMVCSDAVFAVAWDRFNNRMETLTKSVENLADSIAAYNKPVFEAQLTKQERRYYDWQEERTVILSILWNKVWAKDKTIVLGGAARDKKFGAFLLKTTDPELVFSGGIRVGASVKVLEQFLGDSLTSIKAGASTIKYSPEVVSIKGNRVTVTGPIKETDVPFSTVRITCVNGVITEIFFDFTGPFKIEEQGILSRKAMNFAETQAKKMGMSGMK